MPRKIEPEMRDLFEELLFHSEEGSERFTQDSPIYPDVWFRFLEVGVKERVDLIFTPHKESSSLELIQAMDKVLGQDFESQVHRLTSSGGMVVCEMNFWELLECLNFTKWWWRYLWDEEGNPKTDWIWFTKMVGAVVSIEDLRASANQDKFSFQKFCQIGLNELKEAFPNNKFPELRDSRGESANRDNNRPSKRNLDLSRTKIVCETKPLLWSVCSNREAFCALTKSNSAVKGDAARRLFEVDGSGITWAVIDTGIDASHPAFDLDEASERIQNSRVVKTLDFTLLRELLNSPSRLKKSLEGSSIGELSTTEVRESLISGSLFDWSILEPLLEISYQSDSSPYRKPKNDHGTHVAGILGASRSYEDGPVGICPGIELFDLRVFDAKGNSDEFTILAALSYVRWLNKRSSHPVIHGVNLSLSLFHHVKNYACGRTPVCEECERLVGEGTVVVAAAGNSGRAVYIDKKRVREEGFRSVSITDPGNAEAVITVGATHRNKPHTYEVSYFSRRGPTGEGRLKPALLAPGEKITAPIFDGDYASKDGTSMAAPHVSGAAALLLARNRELIGNPQRVKEILCSTATDLGRERHFQGAGMLDILRAMQSV